MTWAVHRAKFEAYDDFIRKRAILEYFTMQL